MTQQAKIIDITRTYVPVDPRAFPETMHGTLKEDHPEHIEQVVPYEGYNFMPTSYGYRSYFGVNSAVGITSLSARVDKIFIIQNDTYENILVALCDDGIWTKAGNASGDWVHAAVLAAPILDESHKSWSYCIISGITYCYRAGEASYYKLGPEITYAAPDSLASAVTGLTAIFEANASAYLAAGTYSWKVAYKAASGQISAPCASVTKTTGALGQEHLSWDRVATAVNGYRVYRTTGTAVAYFDVPQIASATVDFTDLGYVGTAIVLPDASVNTVSIPAYFPRAVVPTFLNMAGQIGIFKAGGRLGFWDSEDSIAWSSLDDQADFTPDIETLAGDAKFLEVQGRIINILPHGEGFMVYAARSVVWIRQDVQATFMWNPKVVLTSSGVAFMEEACTATPDTTHFAWTDSGMYKIESGKAEIIIPEVTDYLKENKLPLYLKVLEGRYLTIGLMDPLYINGLVNFSSSSVPPLVYSFPGGIADRGITINPVTITGQTFCSTVAGLDQGVLDDTQAEAEYQRTHPIDPGTAPNPPTATTPWTPIPTGGYPPPATTAPNSPPAYQPVWVCSISAVQGPDVPTFGPTPCATPKLSVVGDLNMNPADSDGGKVGDVNHTVNVNGADAYVDGWTIERFVAIQEAIWAREAQQRAAFINAILNRAGTDRVTTRVADCIAENPTHDECSIGTFITGSGGRHFGFNKCSFWLTRYLTDSTEIRRVQSIGHSCSPAVIEHITPNITLYHSSGPGVYPYGSIWIEPFTVPSDSIDASANAMISIWNSFFSAETPSTPHVTYDHVETVYDAPVGQTATFTSSIWVQETIGGGAPFLTLLCGIGGQATCPSGYTCERVGTTGFTCTKNGGFDSTRTLNAYNKGIAKQHAPYLSTGVCVRSGWKYTDAAGNTIYLPAGASCDAPVSPATPPAGISGGGGGLPPATTVPVTNTPPSDSPGGSPASVGAGGATFPDPISSADGTFCTQPFTPVTIPGLFIPTVTWPSTSVTLPGSTFLLQDGSIGPVYPTFAGALVYDMQLKKWGKLKCNYKQLLDYSPINASTGGIIPYDTFGVNAGALLPDGFVYVFDEYPSDSYITYGKIGFYRLGMTDLEEVKVDFRRSSTGLLAVQTSLDGKSIEVMLGASEAFTNITSYTLKSSLSGRWHNIRISGNYDITKLTIVGHMKSRR